MKENKCPDCGGKGTVVTGFLGFKICSACKGTGTVKSEAVDEIREALEMILNHAYEPDVIHVNVVMEIEGVFRSVIAEHAERINELDEMLQEETDSHDNTMAKLQDAEKQIESMKCCMNCLYTDSYQCSHNTLTICHKWKRKEE